MTHIPFLFNQTIEQMRRIGSRGGKTHARNWRARQRATLAVPRDTPCLPRRRRRLPPKPWRSWMRNSLGCEGLKSPSGLVGPQGIYRNIGSVYHASPLTNGGCTKTHPGSQVRATESGNSV